VPAVALEHFLAPWCEIARIPACEHELRNDSKISVASRCLTRKSEIDQAEGLSCVLDPIAKARPKVHFLSLLGWRPAAGSLWCVA